MTKFKQHTTVIIIIALMIITIIPISIQATQGEAPTNNDIFSIMQISDTQYLSASFPQLFLDTTNWIANHATEYNVRMVIHTGDIVDNIGVNAQPQLATADPAQWSVANQAMLTLQTANIPYCWDAGNHDQIPWNSPTGTWSGSSYAAFDLATMRAKPYWVSDNNDGKNTATMFNYNGYKFLIINLEYLANDATINWMKDLLDSHRDWNVIIAAHNYLNYQGKYGVSVGTLNDVSWCNSLKTILDGYPNVFLTLNGHDPLGTAYQKMSGNREEIYFNRGNIGAGQSAASVRIYTFNLETMQVQTTTWSIYANGFLTNAGTSTANQFSFNANLKLPLAVNATQSTSNAQYTSTVSFTAYPSGGVAPYTYQWYQGINIVGTNSSIMQFVAYPAGNYAFSCKITDADGATATTNMMALSVSPLQALPSTTTPTTPPTPVPTATPTYTLTPTPTPTSSPTPDSTITITPSATTNSSTLSMTTIYITIAAAAIIAILAITAVLIKRPKK